MYDQIIDIGIFYICVDFSIFFEDIQHFENKLVDYYNNLESKEKEFRKKFTDEVKILIEETTTNFNGKLSSIEQKEEDIKAQLQKLTKILIQCENLEKKKEDDEIKSLIKKTKSTIDELNLEFIKLRDDAHTLIIKYDSLKNFIKEIFEN